MLTANAGFLLAFVAGNYLAYHTIPYIGILVSVGYLASFVYFPETPIFLLRRKKEQVFLMSNVRFFILVLSQQKYMFYKNSWPKIHSNFIEMLKSMQKCPMQLAKSGRSYESESKKWRQTRRKKLNSNGKTCVIRKFFFIIKTNPFMFGRWISTPYIFLFLCFYSQNTCRP